MEQNIYITKYALSEGILEKEARIRDYGNGHLRAFVNGHYSSYGVGSEAFFTKEDALKNAEKRRLKKIESLKKQIEKLKVLRFE